MKVLLTSDTYFPMINGVVTSTYNLYNELKAMGHEVKIVTLSCNGEERVEGDIYYLKSFKTSIYPEARIKVPFYNKLVKDILAWKPDIVHSQSEFSTMVVAKHIVSKLGIPQIHTYHTMYEDYLKYIFKGKVLKKGAAARITKVLLNSMAAVVAPTDKTKEALLRYGVSNEIYTVPTGIDLSRFQKELESSEKNKLRAQLGINSDDKVLVYIGRIAEEKNIEEVIRLLPKVLLKVKETKLLIAGGGPYLDKLKTLAAVMQIEGKVIFVGMVNPEEVYKYYKLGDAFVTASSSETQGLTYLEALSCGCPVICKYDKCIDGVIIQGENGFSYKEESEFIDFASKVLTKEDLREEMSVKAQAKAEEYSSRTFANKILDVYNEVIDYAYTENAEMRASGM